MPNPKLNKLYQLYKDNVPDMLGGMDEQSFVNKFSDPERLAKLYDLTQENSPDLLGGMERNAYIQKFGESKASSFFGNQMQEMQKPRQDPVVGVSSKKEIQKASKANEPVQTEEQIPTAQESVAGKGFVDLEMGKNPFDLVDLSGKDPIQEGAKRIRNLEERASEGIKANPERTTYDLGMEALNNSYSQASSNINKVKIFVNNLKGDEDAFDDYMASLQAVSSAIEKDPQRKNPNTNKLLGEFNKEWGNVQNTEMVNKYLFPSIDFLNKIPESRNSIKEQVPNYVKYLEETQKEQAKSDIIDYTTPTGFVTGAANKIKRVLGGTFLGDIAAIGKGLTDLQAFYDLGEWAKKTEELNPSATRHQRNTVEDYIHDEETGLDYVFDIAENGVLPSFKYFVDPKTGNMPNVIVTETMQKKIDEYAKNKKFESRRVPGAIISQGADELIQEMPELAIAVATDGILSAGMKGLRGIKATGVGSKLISRAKALANTEIANKVTVKHVGAHVGELLSGTIEGSADFREEGLRAGLSEDEVSAFQLAAGLNAGMADAINPMEVMAVKNDINIFFKKKMADYAAGKISKMDLLKETGANLILNTGKNLTKETFSEGVVEPIIGNKIRETFNELKGTDFESTEINLRNIEAGFWLSALSSGAFSVPTSVRISKGGLMSDAIKYAINNPDALNSYFKGRRSNLGGEALDRENYLRSVIDQVKDAGLSKEDQAKAATLMIDRQNASLEVEKLIEKYGPDAPLVKKKRDELFDFESKIDDLFLNSNQTPPAAPGAEPQTPPAAPGAEPQTAPAAPGAEPQTAFTYDKDGRIVEVEVISRGKDTSSVLVNGKQTVRANTEIFNSEVEATTKALEGVELKNEGKAEAPTKENVTERLNINNPFYKKVEDALVKLGLIEKYNPETGEGDVVGGLLQATSDGGISAGKMMFNKDGSISYFDGDVKVSFDKNGNVIHENTKEVAENNKENEIEGKKEAIANLEKTRDSEGFKYKEVTETDPLGNRKKVRRLKTAQELKESTDKINVAINKAKSELEALEGKKPTTQQSEEEKIDAKRAEIERRRQEELDTTTSAGYGVIASDYLFTGGRGSMLSTDYLLQALTASFPFAGKQIDAIRNKYASKLGNISDDINSKSYNDAINEIRNVINSTYQNAEIEALFDEILNNSTGFVSRVGNRVSSRLEALNDEHQSKINAKYDAEYVDAVKKGEMTKEQAMKALEEIGRKNSAAYAEIAALEQPIQSEIEVQKADIEIGKVGNTEYEVKVDGVYYQGKKLDNPENKTHRQLIEADTERRRQAELEKIITDIFPNTKVKQILYRATKKGLTEFKASDETRGIYTSMYKKEVDQYLARDRNNSEIYTVILNTENPKEYKKRYSSTDTRHTNLDEAIEQGYDGLIVTGRDGEINEEVAVISPNQVHILNKDELNAIDEINAKYDAEIKALEQQPTSAQPDIEAKKADIERLKKEKQEELKPLIEEKEKIEKEIDKLEKQGSESNSQEIEHTKKEIENLRLKDGSIPDNKISLFNKLSKKLRFLQKSFKSQVDSLIDNFSQINNLSERNIKLLKRYIETTDFTFEEIIQELEKRDNTTYKRPIELEYFEDTVTRIDKLNNIQKSVDNNTNERSKQAAKELGIDLDKVYYANELDAFVQKYGSKQTKFIWNLIKNIATQLKIPTKFLLEGKENNIAKGHQGEYSNGQVANRASLLTSPDVAARTIVHELVHGVTSYIIDAVKYNNTEILNLLTQKQINSAKKLSNLLREIQSDSLTKDFYGAKNEHEILAELTHDGFVEALQNKQLNFVEQFLDYILDILGIPTNAYNEALGILKDMIENPIDYKAKGFVQEGVYYSKSESTKLQQSTQTNNQTEIEATAKALEVVEKTNKSLWDKIKDLVNKISQKLGGISDSQHINDFKKAKTEWSKLSRKEKQLKRADYELDGLSPSEGGYYKVGDVLFDLDLSENIFNLLISGKKLLSILPKLGVTTFNAENRPAEEMFAHYSDGKIHLNNNSAYENIRQLTRAITHELGHHEFTKLSEKEKDYVNSLSIETGMALQYKAQGDGKQTSASLEEENFADYVMQYFQGKLYGDETLLNKIPERLRKMFDDKYGNLLNENNDISEAYHKAKADGSNPELVKAVEELLGKGITPTIETELKEAQPTATKTELISEIQSKPLSHVPGLGMGQSQAIGTYVSTEKKNRYETDANKAEPVSVTIKNPLLVESDYGFVGKRNGILNKNRDKFSKRDSITYDDLPERELSIDDLNELGAEKLAQMVTDELKKQGYDSIYFRENDTQEGELIVFDKKNVIFPNVEKKIEDIGHIPYDKRTDKQHADYIKSKLRKAFGMKGFSDRDIENAMTEMDQRAISSNPSNPDLFYRKIKDVVGGETKKNDSAKKEDGLQTQRTEDSENIFKAWKMLSETKGKYNDGDVVVYKNTPLVEYIYEKGGLVKAAKGERFKHFEINALILKSEYDAIKSLVSDLDYAILALASGYLNPWHNDYISGTQLGYYSDPELARVRYAELSNMLQPGGSESNEELSNKLNKNNEEEQGRDTEVISSEAEAVISEAEAIEDAEDEKIGDVVTHIEDALREIESKVGKLTESYSTEDIDHEYPNKIIDQKAKKEINKYAKEIAKLNGWEIPAKNGVYDNIAPAGGDVVMHFNIPGTDLQIYTSIKYDPDYYDQYDNYKFTHFFYRVENPKLKGTATFVGPNRWEKQNKTAKEFAEILRKEAKPFVDRAMAGKQAPAPEVKPTTDKKAEVDSAIDEIWDYFGKLGIASTPEQQAKDLEMAIRLVSLYIKKGYYKIEEIVNAGVEKLGKDKMDSILQFIKNGYLAYQSDATDEEIEKMDDIKAVRNYTITTTTSNERPDQKEGAEPNREEKPGSGRSPQGGKLGGGKLDTAPKRPQPDLFSGIEEQRQDRDRGDTEAGGIRKEPVGAEETKLPSGRGGGSGQADTVSTIDRETYAPIEEKPGEIVLLGHPESNFVIDESVTTKTFNQKARFQDNLTALRTLATIMREKRYATTDEQKTLSKYVGWGGLKVVLNPLGAKWSDSDEEFRPLVMELMDIVSELDGMGVKKIMSSIKASTLSAFYTPVPVINGMYKALEQLGFVGGHVLDPSAGIGHFTGAMPGSMRNGSSITHVELEPLTGAILKHLYPKSNTYVSGYESASIPNNYFDLVISNIPFGDISVYDKAFSTPELSGFTKRIHNYFFAKAIQSAKEGGVIAFITSSAVMDSPGNMAVRQYINQNAEFIGAIRLPESTFKGNANTQVVSDIIFLRKTRDPQNNNAFLVESAIEVEHKNTGQPKRIRVNEYFVNNPNHVIGKFMAGGQYRDDEMTVVAGSGVDLQSEIEKIIKNYFPSNILTPSSQSYLDAGSQADTGSQSAFDAAKYGEIYIDDDGLPYVKLDGADTIRKAVPKTHHGKVKDFIRLRDILSNQYYLEAHTHSDDEQIERNRRMLVDAYNTFVSKHGKLHSKQNQSFLGLDINGFNILSLETDKGNGRADILSKRVILAKKHITRANNIEDAITISINDHGRININRIASLLDQDPASVVEQNYGILFYDHDGSVVSREEYLSGNVKKKLSQAIKEAETNPIFQKNVEELRNVIPEDVDSTDIEVNIGSRWIPTKIYEDFINEIFNTTAASVHYSQASDKFTIKVAATVENKNKYGTERRRGDELIEDAMHNVTPVVRDKIDDGPPAKYVINAEQTERAREKQDLIKEEFKDWIWKDETRRRELGRLYNDLFNTTVKRTHDGSKLTIDGINDSIKLRPHQLDAVSMLINNNGGIIDHIVGAGKTYVMIAAAMKMKQVGLANKPTIIGLKSTIPHLVRDAKTAFPGAKILTPSESDFSAKKRKSFLSKIQNNDWDLIIMSHEQFSSIPQDPEIQMITIESEIELLDKEIEEASERGDEASKQALKGLEKRKNNLLSKLQELIDSPKDKEILDFKKIGIDHLMVDESQMFKNLEYATKINRIAGLGNKTGSKRSFNMLVAARTLQKMHNGDKGVTFSSGTPISNSLVEMYLLFKYLRPSKLEELGYKTFDSWVTQFAEATLEVEFSVSSDLKQKMRFRRFINLPELSMLYNEITDVRNDSNLKLPKPVIKQTENENGELVRMPTLIAVPQSEYQKEWTRRLIEFSNQPHGQRDGDLIGKGSLSDSEQSAAMLMVTNLSNKLSIDMRLIDPNAEDNPTGKLSAVANNVANIYKETDARKGTQLIFSDTGTPKSNNTVENLKSYLEDELNKGQDDIDAIFGAEGSSLPTIKVARQKMIDTFEITESEADEIIRQSRDTEGQFNVYSGLKKKLIQNGVPGEQIAFIHDYKTKKAKEDLFEKVNKGEIRIVIGSTQKLGTGVNVQKKIVALHHVDAQWNPAAMEQRNGRGIRQGNENEEVGIYNYGTELTLDAYKYQLIATKQRFINQIKDGSIGADRTMTEGEGEDMSSQTMVAILSGNPLLLKMAKLDTLITKLKRSKKSFTSEYQKTETLRNATEAQVPIVSDEIAKREIDLKAVSKNGKDENGKINISVSFDPDVKYESTKELGQIINEKKKDLVKKPLGMATLIGKVNGLELFGKTIRTEVHGATGLFAEIDTQLYLKGEFHYPVTSSVDPTAQGMAIANAINKMEAGLDTRKADLVRHTSNIEKYNELLKKSTWERQQELDDAVAEHKRISDILFNEAKANEAARNNDNDQGEENMPDGDGKLRDENIVYDPHDRNVFLSVVSGVDTRNSQAVYLARINDQLTPETYSKNVKPLIKKYNGEWNRSSQNIVFYDRQDAIEFKKEIEDSFNIQDRPTIKFQKTEAESVAEKELADAENDLKRANRELAKKRRELYSVINESNQFFTNERPGIPRLFDAPIDTSIDDALEQYNLEVLLAKKNLEKAREALSKAANTKQRILFQNTDPEPGESSPQVINIDDVKDISSFLDSFFGPVDRMSPPEDSRQHTVEVKSDTVPNSTFIYKPGFNWYSDEPAIISDNSKNQPGETTIYDTGNVTNVKPKRKAAKKKGREIKNPDYKRALSVFPGSAEDYVRQAFIRGEKIHSDILRKFFPKIRSAGGGELKDNVGEIRAKIGLINNSTGYKTMGDLADRLFENQFAETGAERFTVSEIREAIEEVLLRHNGTATMVDAILSVYFKEQVYDPAEIGESIPDSEINEAIENQDEDTDQIWDYFDKKTEEGKDKYVPTQEEIDSGVYDKDGNFVLFQKTEMDPTSNESVGERVHKIKCP